MKSLISSLVALLAIAWTSGACPALAQAAAAESKDVDALAARMSWQAQEMMRTLHFGPLLEKLAVQHERVERVANEPPSVQTLFVRQQYLATRQILMEHIEAADLQVRTVTGRIDDQLADAYDLRSALARKRDRQFTANVFTNFIFTGIAQATGHSIEFVPGGETQGRIIEIIDGVSEVGLPLYYLKQQRSERHLVKPVPNLLGKIFDQSSDGSPDYPPAVWTYLNNVPSGAAVGQTRRKLLIDKWTKYGMIEVHGKPRVISAGRVPHVTGTVSERHRVTLELLEDRAALLADLKAVVNDMDYCLLELMKEIKEEFPINF